MISNLKLLGLGPMGKNLALNMLDHDIPVTGFDISSEARDNAAQAGIPVACSLEELVGSEKEQKAYWLMVPDSKVEAALQALFPYLQPRDILIDGGNSYFQDTERRSKEIAGLGRGIGFLGIGVSGGVEGARSGPCFMAGGDRKAYLAMEGIFTTIAARVDDISSTAHLGQGGAGHFAKMVHNGIEYGMMQAIGDAYVCLREGHGSSQKDIQITLQDWSEGSELSCYLLSLASRVLAAEDSSSGVPLVNLVKDLASQKGTGIKVIQTAADLGVPIPNISAAVEMRFIAADQGHRRKISELFPVHPIYRHSCSSPRGLIEDALHLAFITTYAQGFHLLAAGAQAYGYSLDLCQTARLWQGGSIIRSALLEKIQEIYRYHGEVQNFLVTGAFSSKLEYPSSTSCLRRVVKDAIECGLPIPVLSQSLMYYDSYRQQRLESASLVALLRDCFGAHTYQRTDAPGSFHTLWNGDGTEVRVNKGG